MKKKITAIIGGAIARGLSQFTDEAKQSRRIGTVPGKKLTAIVALLTVSIFAANSNAFAQMDHSMDSHDHMAGEMKHEESMKMPGGMAMHAMEIDGHKLNFHIMDKKAFRNYMDNMGHTTHKMKEGMTHYVMLDITDPAGKKIKRSKVKLKVIGPDKKADEKVAFPMMGNFGAEFDMSHKGKYQIMTLFKVKKEKHHGGFWHEMK